MGLIGVAFVLVSWLILLGLLLVLGAILGAELVNQRAVAVRAWRRSPAGGEAGSPTAKDARLHDGQCSPVSSEGRAES